MYKTKQELVESLGLKNIDYALPQQWVDAMQFIVGKNETVAAHFVWSYDEDEIFGHPFPLSKTGILILCKYASNLIKQ